MTVLHEADRFLYLLKSSHADNKYHPGTQTHMDTTIITISPCRTVMNVSFAANHIYQQEHIASRPPCPAHTGGVRQRCRHLQLPPSIDAQSHRTSVPRPRPLAHEGMRSPAGAYRYSWCLTTSKRCSLQRASWGMPAFCLAMATCIWTVSTPSRSGSSTPRCHMRVTMTP